MAPRGFTIQSVLRCPHAGTSSRFEVCDDLRSCCGAGGVLAQLQKLLPESVTYTGYEISPHAHAISRQFENATCKYILGDAFADCVVYDLVLVMDVVEHVEDCFTFLRQVRQKGRLKLYHIPLDAHASAVLRGTNAWDSAGHLHLFTIETALKTLRHTGHRVLDWMLTDGALSAPTKHSRTRLINPLRKVLSKISPALAARLIGGYSILIFAE